MQGSSMPDCIVWGLHTCSCPVSAAHPPPHLLTHVRKSSTSPYLPGCIIRPHIVPDTPNGQSPPSQSFTHPTPQLATASAVFCGSKGSSGGGVLAVLTAQKRQPRVHVSPIQQLLTLQRSSQTAPIHQLLANPTQPPYTPTATRKYSQAANKPQPLTPHPSWRLPLLCSAAPRGPEVEGFWQC